MTRTEKETIVLFNEAETMAEIFTYNKALQSKLERLCTEYPSLFKKDRINRDGSIFYTVPKKYVGINSPKRINSKYRQKLAENAKQLTGRRAAQC